MSHAIILRARKGCELQINELWRQSFGGCLVCASKSIFQHEQEYLEARQIFTSHEEGQGRVYVGTIVDDDIVNISDLERQKLRWIVHHRPLFEQIAGLKDAVSALGMNVDCWA